MAEIAPYISRHRKSLPDCSLYLQQIPGLSSTPPAWETFIRLITEETPGPFLVSPTSCAKIFCPPPSLSPPGPRSVILYPVYGLLGFFQQPEMNLQGPTGSAASSSGHKARLALSSAIVYVINEWAERWRGNSTPPTSPDLKKVGGGWIESPEKHVQTLCQANSFSSGRLYRET